MPKGAKQVPAVQSVAVPIQWEGESIARYLIDTKGIPKMAVDALRERAGASLSTFEHLVIDGGYLDEKKLQEIKSEANKWEMIDLEKAFVDMELSKVIPRRVMVAQKMLPFRKEGHEVHVAALHPGHHIARRLLEKKYGSRIKFFLATDSALQQIFAMTDPSAKRDKAQMSAAGKSESVVELVEQLLLQSINRGSSDIHIEPNAHHTVVRERIDGLLHHTMSITKDVHEHLTMRIKVMANLATDEHAIPQDGKLVFWTPAKKRVDVRISIVPTYHGEKIVMRLLVAHDEIVSLDTLGCSPRDRALLEASKNKSWGMIIIAGPTGSGKSTTLYTLLQQMNNESLNLSTIEDPVEYEIRGANQIQVNEKTGLTFASGLRALLRQDPNIILVGEIRDRETADIGINAAMTGHLVLSTLHTNNAATAIPRLIDMKIQPFLIASVLHLVIAQRLVRKICVHCREEKVLSEADLAASLPPDMLRKLMGNESSVRISQGKGCSECENSGYHGRCAIFEMLLVDEEMREMIMQNATMDAVEKAAIAKGMTTMLEDGIVKVKQGITTIHELLRVMHT